MDVLDHQIEVELMVIFMALLTKTLGTAVLWLTLEMNGGAGELVQETKRSSQF